MKVYLKEDIMQYMDIRFPNLDITFHDVGRSFFIGDFEIMYYGVVIACGFLLGYLLVSLLAKRSGQSSEIYLDYLLCMMIPAIIGARIYYVVFSWDYYKANPGEIINLRHGGLGIVGGILAGVIVLLIFSRVRKLSATRMLDTLTAGLLVGQILGRWGNFFNREAFGGFCDGLFAMQIPVEYFEKAGRMTEIRNTGLLDQLVTASVNGGQVSCIQVHPTFLYEGLWNLVVLLIILFWQKRKTFDGELLCIYMMGYGAGRFFIESLRVDQLTIGHTGIAATQVVCVLAFVSGLLWMIFGKKKARRADGGCGKTP